MSSAAKLQNQAAYRAVMECTNRYNHTSTLFSNGFIVDTAEAPKTDITHWQSLEEGRNAQIDHEFLATWSTSPPAAGFKRMSAGAIDSRGASFAPPIVIPLDAQEIAIQTPPSAGDRDLIVWLDVTTQTGKTRRSYTDLARVSQGYPCIHKVVMGSDLNSDPAYLTSLENVPVMARWQQHLSDGEFLPRANDTCRGRKVVTYPDDGEERPRRGSKATGSTSANTTWVTGQLHQATVELWTSIITGYNVSNYTAPPVNITVTYDPLPGACFTSGGTRGKFKKHNNADRSREWCERTCTAQWDCVGYEHTISPKGPPCLTFFKHRIGYAKVDEFPNRTCYLAFRSGNVTKKAHPPEALFEPLLVSDAVVIGDTIQALGDVCCQRAGQAPLGLFARSHADTSFDVISGDSAKKHVVTTMAGDRLVVFAADDKTGRVKISISDVSTAAVKPHNPMTDPRSVSLNAPSVNADATAVAAGGANTVAFVTRQALTVGSATSGLFHPWIDLSKHGWTASGAIAVSEDGLWVALSGVATGSGKAGVALVQTKQLDARPRTILTGAGAKSTACVAMSKTHLVVGGGGSARVFSVAKPDAAPLTLTGNNKEPSFGQACAVRGRFAVVAAPTEGAGYFRVYDLGSSGPQASVVCTITGTKTSQRLGSTVAFLQSQDKDGVVTVVASSIEGTLIYEVRASKSGYSCLRAGYLAAAKSTTQLSLAVGAHAIVRPLKGSTTASPAGFDLAYYCDRDMVRVPGHGCTPCPAGGRSFGGFHATCNMCGENPVCVGKDGAINTTMSVNRSVYTGNNSQLIPGQEIWAEMTFLAQNGNEVVLTTGTQIYDPSPPVMKGVMDLFPVPAKVVLGYKMWNIGDINYTSIADRAVGMWSGCHDDESGIASARMCLVANSTGANVACKDDPKLGKDDGTWELVLKKSQYLQSGEVYYFRYRCVNKAGLASEVRMMLAIRILLLFFCNGDNRFATLLLRKVLGCGCGWAHWLTLHSSCITFLYYIHQAKSDGMMVDLTPPRITRIADGFLTSFLDVDYSNVMDCVYLILEVEDPESPMDHFQVAVFDDKDEYILPPHHFGCPVGGCTVGKVTTFSLCTRHPCRIFVAI